MYVCTTHHTQLHKTHTVTHKKGKKLVRKEKKKQRKKTKYASIKQQKARQNILLINLQLILINKN